MSGKTHTYTCALTWTGNTGAGTASYTAYARDHVFSGAGKPDLPGSSDPAFRGDARRYNPEELLIAPDPSPMGAMSALVTPAFLASRGL